VINVGAPSGALAEPRETVPAILFLTSTESSFNSGGALAVDGGRGFH
jgi:NAD(P)-dependent dehydrogenase (short-subunit alcohol dehydrogenase family)